MATTTMQKAESPKTELSRSNPFESMSLFGRPFDRSFDRFFEDFLGRRQLLEENGLIVPALDVSEDEECVTVTAELPGLKKEDVKIQFEDGVLSISGEKSQESEKKSRSYYRLERRYGAFNRAVTLPAAANIDKAEADFKDGVLTIRMPLREEAKPKVVKIK